MKGINKEVVNFFLQKKVNLEQNPNEMEKVLRVIQTLVTENQNKRLMNPVTENEVREALVGLGGDKALGPNGFPATFFQKLWHIFQKDLWEIVEESRASGFVLKNFNNAFIVLVLKKDT